MAPIGGLRRQDDLAITGQRQAARALAVVVQRDAPDLDIVFGRDGDLHRQTDPVIGAAEFGLVRIEADGLALRRCARSAGRRPTTRAALPVLHVEPGAPVIQRGVGAPAGEVKVLPAAEAAPALVISTL